ncbi:MAG: rubredoxin-like domain-containing protein [Haloferacaceae archaeon]
MTDETREAPERVVGVGQTLYTADGRAVGTVRGVDEDSLVVSVRDDVGSFSVEHVRAGHAFGEAELVWRCTECGEVGQLTESLPEVCPGCGVEREALMYWTED